MLFLDDWHWADAASVAVVEELVTAPEPAALMLVLAYRDNELAPTGRASIAIERLRDNGVPITAIALPPLPRTEIEALVREAFRCHREHAAQLAAHIDSRTRGNPLFVRSFLQSLHDAGRLKRNAAGEWSCDLDALARDTGDASVIDLLVARVGRLPANTRDLLEIAACLGNEFRTRDLAVAACFAESDITGMLTAATEAALVTAGFASYRFVHDRVQEAVYMSIEADRRAHLHVTIGRRLHGHSPGEPTTVRVVPDLLAGIFKVAETAMYAALAWLAAAERANGAERAQLRARAEQQLVVLQQLASHCEENCSHKALLVEAELARVERRVDESIALFDRAIDAAARAGFQQYTALGCELAARAWRARGFPRAARAYMQDAYHAYAAWGASAKLRVLEARYPELLRAPHGPGRGDADALIGGPTESSEPFDMLSVARATQAISREIDPDLLLTRLMSVFIENAGARRGALVKVDGDEMQVVAAAEGFEVRLGSATTPLPASSHVVESIVRYVVRTGESVRLDDASREGRFTRDPQVRQRGSRSIVCLPLRMQDRAIGAVFLENELGAAAFTRRREIVLDLLARQAAISLENSRLYADLMAANRKLEEARVAAEAANRTKDEFLAMLGHELRNPLSPVLTACQLMAMANRGQFAREREVIERQVTHMIRLVDDLLDVSRIARGKIELFRKHLDLREVVDSAIELVTPLLEDRGSRIALSATDQPLPIYADPTRLAQVLSNVLTNAIKFSPKCAVVEVSIEDSGGDAIVRVVDHGTGIAAELLPAIFDLFVQAQQPRDRRLGGLGLGLSIAKNLVELHGGAIAAHSDGPGQGSRASARS